MEDLTLILCDSDREGQGTVDFAADLNVLAEAIKTQHVAITRDPKVFAPEDWENLRALFQAHPNLKMGLVFSPAQQEEQAAWQNLPWRVAALRQNWAQTVQAVVWRTSAVAALGFAEVSDPVWDCIIRTAKSPESLQACSISTQRRPDEPEPLWELPALAPAIPDSSRRWLKEHLENVTPEELVPNASSPVDAIALKAGLLQIHDYLEESHELSQSIEGKGRNRAGNYWHAIMHRREPDYGNAKYWFRHVGQHPIFEPLRKAVDAILQDSENSSAQKVRQKLLAKSQWDPFTFVDFCQECAKGNDPAQTRIAEDIQWQEMRLLLEQTARDAKA